MLILIVSTAPLAPACSANPMSELEALGYLQMALQQPLGTGFASTVKSWPSDEPVPRARPQRAALARPDIASDKWTDDPPLARPQLAAYRRANRLLLTTGIPT